MNTGVQDFQQGVILSSSLRILSSTLIGCGENFNVLQNHLPVTTQLSTDSGLLVVHNPTLLFSLSLG